MCGEKKSWENPMEIEYPEDAVQNEQMAQIVNTVFPSKKPLLRRLRDIYLGPGWKAIFYQSGSSWILTGMLYVLVFGFCMLAGKEDRERTNMVALLAFPMLHLAFASISFWAEGQDGVIELKQTMRYSFTYLVSLRMFYASIIQILMDVMLFAIIQGDLTDGSLAAGAVGVSSTFLLAMLSIFLYGHLGSYYHIGMLVFIWLSCSAGIWAVRARVSYVLFEAVPVAVHLAVAAGSFLLFCEYIRKVAKMNAYAHTCYEKLW